MSTKQEDQISRMMKNLVINQKLFNQLDEDRRQWILNNPKEAIALFSRAVENRGKNLLFPVWKTIKLGTGLKTADDFIKQLEKKDNYVNDNALEMLKNSMFTVADRLIKINLIIVNGNLLGFRKRTPSEKIFESVAKNGLYQVPAEVGPQLRLQYQDQPVIENLRISMKLICCGRSCYSFNVNNDEGDLSLEGCSESCNGYLDPLDYLVVTDQNFDCSNTF